MDENNKTISNTIYPWVTFKIHSDNYCISSENVVQVLMNDKITPLPESPPYYLGISYVYGEYYPIIDMRVLFGLEPLSTDVEVFADIKSKHLEWVSVLEESVESHKPFALTRDPLKCSFGVWYNSYRGKNATINSILSKIHKPHNEMHHQAVIIDKCRENNDEAGVLEAFAKAKQLCEGKIVPLLEELIETYAAQNRGMVILISKGEAKLGLLVDEISSIEDFDGSALDSNILEHNSNQYLSNVITTPDSNQYLELDTKELFELVSTL